MNGGLRSNSYRHCPRCGRALESGESCECGTRDGLRARCPQFKARSSYRGRHYLDCDGHRIKTASREIRDAFYMAYCCGDKGQYTACPFWMGWKKN